MRPSRLMLPHPMKVNEKTSRTSMSKPSTKRSSGSSRAGEQISVINRCRGLRVDRVLLVQATKLIMREYGISSGKVEVSVLDDKGIADLHRKHLGRRAVTDVICFDMSAQDDINTELDVCLALGGEVARRQARANKTSINKELALYTVHGLLHVLGYDDGNAADSERMHLREDELLEQLGVGSVFCGKGCSRK